MSDNLVGLATKERRPNLHYDLINPETGDIYPCPDKGWRYSQETMAQKISEGRILWPKSKSGRPRHKKFFSDLESDFAGFSSFIDCGNTNEGTEEVSRIMGREFFIFPKPRSLIQTLLQQTTFSNDIVLDCFAGTGTTAHAVMALNKQDGGNRRFILVEMDPNVSHNIAFERLRRVSLGYDWCDQKGNQRHVEGLGGGFRYCELGPTLFDQYGQIRTDVSFADLARHVFFTETGQPLPSSRDENPLLGTFNGAAVYLLYNGVMRDAGNVLTPQTLAQLPTYDGQKVIYADGCKIGRERLREMNITFKQIPYEINVR